MVATGERCVARATCVPPPVDSGSAEIFMANLSSAVRRLRAVAFHRPPEPHLTRSEDLSYNNNTRALRPSPPSASRTPVSVRC
ncbi:unnamed protein product [Colias eurytheme]|nr:unnamed protein product [Colias eurytheme]